MQNEGDFPLSFKNKKLTYMCLVAGVKGEKGSWGLPGSKGEKGDQGAQGPPGIATIVLDLAFDFCS